MLGRRLTLLQSVSLNMSMMVGVGPFITIPLLLVAMNGPISMIAWVVGAAIAICDGLVWSELASAFPGSGGTYHYYDAVYGNRWMGRAGKFLFIWQFLASGPLELATGLIGFAAYAGYLFPALKIPLWSVSTELFGVTPIVWTVTRGHILALVATFGIIAMAYRRIGEAGRLMVVLWMGMLATVLWITAEGLARLNPDLVLSLPPESLSLDLNFIIGLGTAVSLAMYAYFGYYQICYLGDEVQDPSKTLPRSILLSVILVAIIYFTMNLGIIGVLPWRDAAASTHVASDFLALVHGKLAGQFAALLVMWTAVAACYAGLLGYSRVPYAAACSGHFFPSLARTHPTGDFPHRSLLLFGLLTALACLADLELVISALMTSRILIQFVGQIFTVAYVRKHPDLNARLAFRMPLYPVPAIVAFLGWMLVFVTSRKAALVYGLGSFLVGLVCFLIWDRANRQNERLRAVDHLA